MKRKIFALPGTGPSQTVLLPLHTLNSIQSQAMEWVFKINVLLYSALVVLQFRKRHCLFKCSSFHLYVPTTAASVPSHRDPLDCLHQHKPRNHNISIHSVLYQSHKLNTNSWHSKRGATSQRSYDKCLNLRRGQRDRFGLTFGLVTDGTSRSVALFLVTLLRGAMLVGRSTTWVQTETSGVVRLVFHETFTVLRGCILIILLIPWLFLYCRHVLKMFSTIHCCRQSRRDTDNICCQWIRLSLSKGTCMWVWICSIANTNGLFLKWPGQSLSSRAWFSKTQANECAGFELLLRPLSPIKPKKELPTSALSFYRAPSLSQEMWYIQHLENKWHQHHQQTQLCFEFGAK